MQDEADNGERGETRGDEVEDEDVGGREESELVVRTMCSAITPSEEAVVFCFFFASQSNDGEVSSMMLFNPTVDGGGCWSCEGDVGSSDCGEGPLTRMGCVKAGGVIL